MTAAARALRAFLVLGLASTPVLVAADRGVFLVPAFALLVADVAMHATRARAWGRRLLAFRYAVVAPVVLFFVASGGAKGDAVILATAWALLGLFAVSSARFAFPLLAAAGLLALAAPETEVPRPEILRVVTYNVEGEVAPAPALIATIRNLGADVVCLQEIGITTDGAEPVALLASFEKGLGMHSASVLDYQHEGNGMGNAILSRFPIDDARTLALPFVEGTPSPRVLIRARVKVRGREVTVVCVHLDRPPYAWPSDNERQVRPLLDWIRGEEPLVIAGDFNAFPSYPSHGQLRDELAEARDRQRWPSGTWPNPLGVFRIDWVWGRGVTPVSQRVLRSGPSDHFPVVADFRLP